MNRPPDPTTRAAELIADGLPIGPTMEPCVCGAGRHAHAGANATGSSKTTGCKRYRADVAWELAYRALAASRRSIGDALREADKIAGAARRAANPVLPGQWRIGVSDLDSCPRAIWYRNKPPADFVPAWEDKREALMGQIIHDAAEDAMRTVYPWRRFEENVVVPGLDRESRYDWYDPITRTLGDIKTAGEWRWDTLADDGPEETTWDKVYLYGLALRQAGIPVDRVRLDYIRRANGHDETFERRYDQARAEAARDRLLGYATALDLDMDLPKTGTGPSNDPLCRRCFARNHCWNIEPAQRAGRSPESYTVLGADPELDAIVWAIGEKIDRSKARLAAQKAEDETKSWLEGVDPGRYGPYEGYETRSSSSGQVDHKARADALARYFDLPDGMRPALDQIPLPRRPESTYMKWGPVRKATLERERRDAARLNDDEKGVA